MKQMMRTDTKCRLPWHQHSEAGAELLCCQ